MLKKNSCIYFIDHVTFQFVRLILSSYTPIFPPGPTGPASPVSPDTPLGPDCPEGPEGPAGPG